MATTQKIEIDVPVPDGFQLTGEYRQPNGDESHVTTSGQFHPTSVGVTDKVFIVRKMRAVESYFPEPLLSSCYIYMNEDYEWFISETRPTIKKTPVMSSSGLGLTDIRIPSISLGGEKSRRISYVDKDVWNTSGKQSNVGFVFKIPPYTSHWSESLFQWMDGAWSKKTAQREPEPQMMNTVCDEATNAT